ncbi:MAG: hypothetical protein LBV52_06125 [Spirochaetaceae bacterium]|jgi:hypothetical protein|nr:hypothetical protein [Spirochaetaceae bacterium]
MPLLQVRDFPEDIYAQIRLIAERERRTVAQQTIVLVQKGLGQVESNKERRLRLSAECNARFIPDEVKAIDVAALVREDRNR